MWRARARAIVDEFITECWAGMDLRTTRRDTGKERTCYPVWYPDWMTIPSCRALRSPYLRTRLPASRDGGTALGRPVGLTARKSGYRHVPLKGILVLLAVAPCL